MATTAKICEVCGVTPNWLIFGWEPKFGGEKRAEAQIRVVDAAAAGKLGDADFVTVPILELSAWRESGVLVLSPATMRGFTVSRARPGARLAAVYQIEGSMAPEIDVGDLVVVDLERREAVDGELVLADVDGLVSVRRLQGGVLVPADARRYGVTKVRARSILAVVVEIRRVMDVLHLGDQKNEG